MQTRLKIAAFAGLAFATACNSNSGVTDADIRSEVAFAKKISLDGEGSVFYNPDQMTGYIYNKPLTSPSSLYTYFLKSTQERVLEKNELVGVPQGTDWNPIYAYDLRLNQLCRVVKDDFRSISYTVTQPCTNSESIQYPQMAQQIKLIKSAYRAYRLEK